VSLRLRFSDQAQTELGEIWDYVAEHSEKAADQRIERIISVCQVLTDTPELGRSREELRPKLRSFPVGNYLIFYRVQTERIDILRILHGARDLEALFTIDDEETFDENG
jgi:toxin ParE1/3/4